MVKICPRCNSENESQSRQCENCEYPLQETVILMKGRYKMTKPYVFSSFRAVYEAEDTHDNHRKVSIREFLPHFVNPSEKMVINNKFEALMCKYRDIRHPNMARIVDFFVEGNYFHVVYEFVNGMDMSKYLESYKLIKGKGYPESMVSLWTLQLCNLLEYLHHGRRDSLFAIDMKPSSVVFRQEDQQLVFIDMGLSNLLQVLGPHYMLTEDPEMYKRSKGNFETVEWDLFCLGNFMFYMLTGMDLISMPTDIIRPLHSLRPDLSQGMHDIVSKAVGIDFRSQYQDVREIIRDIREKVPPLPLRAFDFYDDFVKIKTTEEKIEWRIFLGNEARTGTIGTPPKPPLRMKWVNKLSPSSFYFLSVSNDFLYATSREGIINSFNLRTGEADWKFFLSKNLSAGGLAFEKNLYFVTPSNFLIAIEHNATEPRWKLHLEGNVLASPCLYEEILFVPLYNGTVHAINSQEGKILASFIIEGNIITSPFIHNSTLYITSLNKKICAIDVDREEVKWVYETDQGFSSAPTLLRDTVFAGGHNGTLLALHTDTGQLLWSRNFQGNLSQSVRATQDLIYVITKKGVMIALNPERGNTIWELDLGCPDFEYPFCVGSNTIYIVDARNRLRGIDAYMGKVRFSLSMSHPTTSHLISAGGLLYLASSAGHVVAFGK